ncbi:MAG TPA: hypothetical protein VKF59_11165 [Candidatus Dormibacteraeota bacterium]|nr:hypothetical protein [Candidatus Dormibacteraeota bacterium]
MTRTTIIGLAWSLVTGLAGGWLMLSPWAFAEQQSGSSWTDVTQTAFFTGLGLVVLALLGLVVAVGQAVRLLRTAGMIATAPRAARTTAAANGSPEFEGALVALAQALAADLAAEQDEAGQAPAEHGPGAVRPEPGSRSTGYSPTPPRRFE